MNAENYMKIMQKADTKKLGDSVYRFLSFLCLRANSSNCVTLSNEVLVKMLGVCERSITGWASTLVAEDLINVVYNRRKHQRLIYINVADRKRYVEPDYKDLSPAQRKFKDRFPNREIDCDVPSHVDMDRLLAEIELSFFLKTCDNMSLKSCVGKNYQLILKGWWRDSKYKNSQSNFSTGRNHTRDEMNSLFQNIEDIDI